MGADHTPARRRVCANAHTAAGTTVVAPMIEIPIRFRDLDMLGHVNQSVFHELLEELRGSLFMGLLGELRFPFVIARVELDYLHEVRRDHGFVRGASRVVELGRSKVITEETLSLPDGTVAARARTYMVAWDPHLRRSRALSDEERAALAPQPQPSS